MNLKYNKNVLIEVIYFLSLPDRPTLYGLADHLGITYCTLNVWRRDHTEFADALKKGLDIRSKNNNATYRKYHKTMPKKAIKLYAAGKSKAAVCAALGITYETLATWQKVHPEFKEAVERGKLLEQEHYEQIGYEAMLGKIENFDSKIWALMVKNRFNYSEKNEISGNPDKPLVNKIEIEFIESDGENDDEDNEDKEEDKEDNSK